MNRVSGREIIQAVVEDMHEGREELRYSVLPPGIYRIYLHETDYKRLVPIVKHIADEASQALDEEVDRMNGQLSRPNDGLLENIRSSFAGVKQKAESVIHGDSRKRVWKKPDEGWQIAINLDPNEELEPGDLCVNSELMLPPRIELGAGNPTRNLTTIRRKGATLRFERKYGESQAESRSSAAEHEQRERAIPSQDTRALIRYQQEGEEKIFEITKDRITVGRGGPQSAVDLILDEATKVSREHFVLWRDEISGRFYIRDTSKFGTAVNGVLLRQGPVTGELETVGAGSETELPGRATIELAGSLKIEFEALK